MRIVKFVPSLRVAIIQLYREGHSLSAISKLLDVPYHRLIKWRANVPNLMKQMDEARSEYMVGLIEESASTLAKGYEEVEETKRYTKEMLIDGEVCSVEKTVKTSKRKPDLASIKLLANKYAKNVYNDTIENVNEVRITNRNASMSIEEKLALIRQDSISADYEVIDDDASTGEVPKHIESLNNKEE